MALMPICIDRTSKPPIGTPLRTDGHWSVQGLVGSWAFNEGAGLTAFDGTSQRNAPLTAPALLTQDGYVGTGLSNGADKATIKTGGAILGGLANSTVFAAFKTSATLGSSSGQISGGGNAIYCERGATGSDIYKLDLIYLSTTLYVDFTYRNDPGVLLQQLRPAMSANNGEWHTAAMRKDGTAHSVYYDGVGTTGTYGSGSTAFTNAVDCLAGNDKGDTSAGWNGCIGMLALYSRTLSPNEIAALSANPWQIYEPEIMWINVGGGATTSSADPGSLTVTGSAATGYRGLVSGAAAGSLAVTGTAATSVKGHVSVADIGAVIISGVNATNYRGLVSGAETGTITATGTDAAGTRSLISAAATGTATVTGANAADYIGHKSVAVTGSVSVTGTDSTGVYTPVGSTTSAAQPGAVTILGVNASGIRTLISLTEPGVVNLTGVNASGFRGLLSVTETGALAVTGANATDVYTHGEWISEAAPGALAVSGYAAESTFTRLRRVIPIVSGREISTSSGRTIPIIH